MRTSLCLGRCAGSQIAQSCRHWARAAARAALSSLRLGRLRSALKWLWTGPWMEKCMRRKRSMALSRLRNGWWEFSTRLFAQRQVTCRSSAPNSFRAAP
jgi:hypothetical protein